MSRFFCQDHLGADLTRKIEVRVTNRFDCIFISLPNLFLFLYHCSSGNWEIGLLFDKSLFKSPYLFIKNFLGGKINFEAHCTFYTTEHKSSTISIILSKKTTIEHSIPFKIYVINPIHTNFHTNTEIPILVPLFT
jgi:hypothetical protein